MCFILMRLYDNFEMDSSDLTCLSFTTYGRLYKGIFYVYDGWEPRVAELIISSPQTNKPQQPLMYIMAYTTLYIIIAYNMCCHNQNVPIKIGAYVP